MASVEQENKMAYNKVLDHKKLNKDRTNELIVIAQSNIENCEICKSRKLTNYEPKDNHGCDGCDAGDELLLHNMKLIKKIINKYSDAVTDPYDLMADGIIAFYKSVARFDINSGIEFSTYAYTIIDNDIKYSDMVLGFIKIHYRMKISLRKIAFIESELMAKLHREPTVSEILDYIDNNPDYNDITKQHVINFKNGIYDTKITSLDEPIDDESDNFHKHEIIGDLDSQYDHIEIIDQVQYVMNRLSSDEQKIIGHMYGILGYEKLTAKQIVKLLDKPTAASKLGRRRDNIIEKVKGFAF